MGSSSFSFKADDIYLFEEFMSLEDRMIMDTSREYAQTKFGSRALAGNQDEHFDLEIVHEMGSLELLGVTLLEQYRGARASFTSYEMIQREMDSVDSGYRSFVSVQSSLPMYSIFAFGTEEQKQTLLPRLATGEIIGRFELTEPKPGAS